jgi:hypothetical protein
LGQETILKQPGKSRVMRRQAKPTPQYFAGEQKAGFDFRWELDWP